MKEQEFKDKVKKDIEEINEHYKECKIQRFSSTRTNYDG